MSDYNWCHGPNCHTYETQSRVRGSKGNKVLRTRRIKTYNGNRGFYNYFCGQICERDFCNLHAEAIVALAPRREPLETKIKDPYKETHSNEYHTWTNTRIERVDNN